MGSHKKLTKTHMIVTSLPHQPNTSLNGRAWDLRRLEARLAELLAIELLGQYSNVSVYEIFGVPKGGPPHNVLTVAVLEWTDDFTEDNEPVLLDTGRIRVDGFPNWTFGVARSRRAIARLSEAFFALQQGCPWELSGKPLVMGSLEGESPLFVPPDSSTEIPVNRLLKNNFWNGSHVIRLCDVNKTTWTPFLNDRLRLQSLSGAISAVMPIQLAGMVDFLGDVLIQIPVTAIVARIRQPRQGGPVEVVVTWRSDDQSRSLRAAGRMRFDNALVGAATSASFTHEVQLSPIVSHAYPVEAEIWDEQSGVLLAASSPVTTLSQGIFNIRMGGQSPRLYTTRDAKGELATASIQIVTSIATPSFGESRETSADRWRKRRTELEELKRLADTRDFVQYRPELGRLDERVRALDDLRFLIEKHGEQGVDLWDPYLSAEDLLQTLFGCTYGMAPLRAITDGEDPPNVVRGAKQSGTNSPSFEKRQKDTLVADCGNRESLRLEYRVRAGPEGWPFHDRFLIFPNGRNGPSAWSLGTSVNSLGTTHHILQKVSNPALVAGAFQNLWGALDRPHHLIWRSW
jgi:hypothetical protein